MILLCLIIYGYRRNNSETRNRRDTQCKERALFNAVQQAPKRRIIPLHHRAQCGVVTVPDERIKCSTKGNVQRRAIYTTIEFYDIAGLVKGASKGEGLGNKFLGHIREVAAIVHVVRCFEDPGVVHVDGRIDPLSDIEVINTELILSDMEVLDRSIQRIRKSAKSDKTLSAELDLLLRLQKVLEEGRSARTLAVSEEEAEVLRELNLLSNKPIIYAANVAEDQVALAVENPFVRQVEAFAAGEGSGVVVISAKWKPRSRSGRRGKTDVSGRTGHRAVRAGTVGQSVL